METPKSTAVSNGNHDKKEEKKEEKKESGKEEETKSSLNCRFYEQQYPEVDDLVIAEVKSIDEMGAYVILKEYNDIEGMIQLGELSRRRIRSINKVIRLGRSEVVVVLRVDKEKGYIDLSKRRVSDDEVAKCEEKYMKAKTVHSILRHTAELQHGSLEDMYKRVGWPLYKKFGHAYDAFKTAITDPKKAFEGVEMNDELKEILMKQIKRRMTAQPLRIRGDFELTCFHYEGIDAIKEALKKGEALSTNDAPIKVKLVAPPLYVIVTTTPTKDAGIAALNLALDAIKDEITKKKGELTIKVAPRPVHEKDEKELQREMDRLNKENTQVPGDDDASDDDGQQKKEESSDDDD